MRYNYSIKKNCIKILSGFETIAIAVTSFNATGKG